MRESPSKRPGETQPKPPPVPFPNGRATVPVAAVVVADCVLVAQASLLAGLVDRISASPKGVMLSLSKHLCRTAVVVSRAEEIQSGRVTGEPAETPLREMYAKYSGKPSLSRRRVGPRDNEEERSRGLFTES